MEGADPAYVSQTAKKRGSGQLGTLGSGNHFLEFQAVDEVYDAGIADAFSLFKNQVIIMVHSGSRGLGHQVCSDYIKVMQNASDRYKINITDRQLASAPLDSPEGKRYYGAMACAANFAMANRHCLAHRVRQSLERHMGSSAEKLGLYTLYDISHNIARWETHDVDGNKKRLCVHRKGATRAFGPGQNQLPPEYMKVGQPVIIPGDMGTYSFILAGTETAMAESFGSTCHGAGRMMSRTRAKKTINGSQLKLDLERKKGIVVIADSLKSLAEEAPQAYKDIESVVNISTQAGLSRKVARLKPLGVIKG
jgi:tRNA-splicing ligase RtcB